MRKKAEIMDRDAVTRALIRISHEITEKNSGAKDLVIVGIKRRGVSLAKFIHGKISEIEGIAPEYAELDTSMYRDDIVKPERVEKQNISVDGKKIILVDDVMFTGRTVRAAIDCLMDMGRPRCIRLAVLVDRGHRELPIRADYVGKNVPTSLDEVIKVLTDEFDGDQRVILYEK
ncbi:MAG: bifunctional pyr operon transcriptional regulator/uracil phosphoribosyltransferase PyrR [Clostridia bacterium]|nr:bifunctional pyr operon transcriptional regulator/uracil phosphoribosyltransferase PyrR [Clostridia bacterium]